MPISFVDFGSSRALATSIVLATFISPTTSIVGMAPFASITSQSIGMLHLLAPHSFSYLGHGLAYSFLENQNSIVAMQNQVEDLKKHAYGLGYDDSNAGREYSFLPAPWESKAKDEDLVGGFHVRSALSDVPFVMEDDKTHLIEGVITETTNVGDGRIETVEAGIGDSVIQVDDDEEVIVDSINQTDAVDTGGVDP
ncbi:hypothetical protein F0562_003050 [Nyssa sinensis]|uniref:Uncharacterized protein n=1 Tax=Nyssa sinensis TaxID=561372 RepID=A0A5J5BY80_9ASTE|nr:hypothetical protein F0562_003050 [Nyssa sinensis]